jgi:hypothetical protein
LSSPAPAEFLNADIEQPTDENVNPLNLLNPNLLNPLNLLNP